MKNKFYLIALVALIGFMSLPLTGCPTPDDGTKPDGGGGTTSNVIDPNLPTVATPTANPEAGDVSSGTTVTLTTATEGAEIWYTTNGSTPAKNGSGSTKYATPFAITPPVTVKAVAVKDGMNDSDVLEAAYTALPGFITKPGATVTKLTENIWENGNIPTSSDEQWFKFTATASTQYIHVDFGTLTALFVQVYDSNSVAVESLSILYSYTKYVSLTVTSGQEYYIKVWPYSSSGTYQIAFNTSTTPPLITLPSTGVTQLTLNTWENGNLPTSSDVQWFKFTATASTQYIHVDFGTLTALFVQVYDSNGVAVESLSILYSYTKYVSLTVTSGQEYYIKVWPYSSSGKGTYRIGFTNTSIILPGTTITQLTVNKWADGNLPTSSDEQWFKFTATASTQYIHVDFGTLTYLYVQVYNSSGATVGSQTDLSGSTKYVSRTVTSGQEYYIKVWPISSSYYGTYKIGFTTSTTAPSNY